METVEKVKALMNHLFESDEVTNINIYKKQKSDIDFNLYYTCSGHMNNKYFNFTIYNIKPLNEDRVRLTNNTDCKEYITEILTKYELL
jgi:hypothetical protein